MGRAGGGEAARERKPAHARELEHLVRCFDTYRSSGRPGTVLVVHGPQAHTVGELVKDWRRELMRRGETVFEASCVGGRTYRPLRNLVSAYYGFLDEIGLMSDTLQRLFGELSDALGLSTLGQPQRSAVGPRPGQIYFYDVLGRFFVEAAAQRPAGLIVRDLHLADSATLAAVTYLAKNFALDPIDAFIPEGVDRGGFKGMLVLTLEASERGDEGRGRRGAKRDLLSGLRRGLADRPHAEFVDLVGVDEEAVRQYLQREDVVARFLASTGGRPENLDAVLGMLPGSSEELLLARLEALGGPSRELLELLSVYNRPMSPDALVQLTDGGERAAAEAIGALLEQRLLARRGGRGKLRGEVAHEASGRLVYAALDGERRKEVHREIAQMLEHQNAHGQAVDLEEIAYHYMRSDDRMRAIHYGLEAAEKLHGAYAYQPARELLEEVLGLVGDGPERADVLERLVGVCSALNEHHVALERCEELAALLPEGQRGVVQRRMGKILLDMGRYDRAVEALKVALEATEAQEEVDLEESVRILSHMAEGLCGQGSYDEAVEVCDRGLARVEGADGSPLLRLEVDLTNTMGKVSLFREEYAAAEAYFESGRRRALEGGWPDAEVRALFNLGTIAVQQRRYEDAEAIFQECLSFGHNMATPIMRAFCLLNLAVIYQKTLRFEEALDCYLHGLATFKMSGNDLQFAVTAMNLAVLYERLGDLPKATALVEAALELSRAQNMRYVYARNCYVRGTIALREEQPGQALEYLMQAREGLESAGRSMQNRLAIQLSMAHHELGQPEERDRWMEQVEVTAESAEGRELCGDQAMALGRFRASERQWHEAEQLMRQARQLYLESELPDKLMQSQYELARVCRELGRREEAKLFAAEAVAELEALCAHVPTALRDRFMHMHRRLVRLQRALEGGTPTVLPEPATTRQTLEGEDGAEGRPVIRIGEPLPVDIREWRERYGRIVGRDRRLLHLFRMVDKVAESDSTVLLIGPSGTGKELFAEAIHQRSHRSEGPLVKVNCAAFVETLLLSELFGHEKGAFTGALSRKRGRFELADGGTIFLDEIGDISLNTQVSLLRVLQERSFERVGGSQAIEVDVRVVAATNRNLEEMVREGTFRLDLYYRLKGVVLELPALKERREDIPYLVRHFAERFMSSEQARVFTPEALQLLATYNWPGNIRELENFVRSIMLFVDGDVIDVGDIQQFDEFFAEGEMSDEAPRLEFADRWWALEEEDEEPSVDETADPGTELASSLIAASSADQKATVSAAAGSILRTGDPEQAIVEQVVRDGMSLQDLKKRLEIECIKRALKETEGNITHAARILKMKRPRLSQIINSNEELGELKEQLVD